MPQGCFSWAPGSLRGVELSVASAAQVRWKTTNFLLSHKSLSFHHHFIGNYIQQFMHFYLRQCSQTLGSYASWSPRPRPHWERKQVMLQCPEQELWHCHSNLPKSLSLSYLVASTWGLNFVIPVNNLEQHVAQCKSSIKVVIVEMKITVMCFPSNLCWVSFTSDFVALLIVRGFVMPFDHHWSRFLSLNMVIKLWLSIHFIMIVTRKLLYDFSLRQAIIFTIKIFPSRKMLKRQLTYFPNTGSWFNQK